MIVPRRDADLGATRGVPLDASATIRGTSREDKASLALHHSGHLRRRSANRLPHCAGSRCASLVRCVTGIRQSFVLDALLLNTRSRATRTRVYLTHRNTDGWAKHSVGSALRRRFTGRRAVRV